MCEYEAIAVSIQCPPFQNMPPGVFSRDISRQIESGIKCTMIVSYFRVSMAHASPHHTPSCCISHVVFDSHGGIVCPRIATSSVCNRSRWARSPVLLRPSFFPFVVCFCLSFPTLHLQLTMMCLSCRFPRSVSAHRSGCHRPWRLEIEL